MFGNNMVGVFSFDKTGDSRVRLPTCTLRWTVAIDGISGPLAGMQQNIEAATVSSVPAGEVPAGRDGWRMAMIVETACNKRRGQSNRRVSLEWTAIMLAGNSTERSTYTWLRSVV